MLLVTDGMLRACTLLRCRSMHSTLQSLRRGFSCAAGTTAALCMERSLCSRRAPARCRRQMYWLRNSQHAIRPDAARGEVIPAPQILHRDVEAICNCDKRVTWTRGVALRM